MSNTLVDRYTEVTVRYSLPVCISVSVFVASAAELDVLHYTAVTTLVWSLWWCGVLFAQTLIPWFSERAEGGEYAFIDLTLGVTTLAWMLSGLPVVMATALRVFWGVA